MSSVESHLKKQMPTDNAAEMAALGSVLLMPDVLDEITDAVRPEDFYDLAHQKLFRALLELHEDGKRADLTLLFSRLTQAGTLGDVGGAAYIHSLFESVQTSAHALHYANLVREKSILRSVIYAGTAMVREAYDLSAESRKVLGDAERTVLGIADSRSQSRVFEVKQIINESMERISQRMDGRAVNRGVSTGLTDLDEVTGGFHPSELIVIAGRPSMGKTALAMNIAEAIGVHQALPTLFVSLEMSRNEVGDRMLSSAARVNGHKLRNGQVSSYDLDELIRVASDFDVSPLFIDDSPSKTVSEIGASARRVKRKMGGLACLVIDYLQLIDPDSHREPREQQVAKITRRLKGMAREMEIPVVVLAQLNRLTESSKDNRPRLSHLRESGAIEQDADVVLFVHREEYYKSGEEKKALEGKAEIIVAKQRNGPVVDVPVTWQKDYTRFVAVDKSDNFSPELRNW